MYFLVPSPVIERHQTPTFIGIVCVYLYLAVSMRGLYWQTDSLSDKVTDSQGISNISNKRNVCKIQVGIFENTQ
jgi:hypothetical protein